MTDMKKFSEIIQRGYFEIISLVQFVDNKMRSVLRMRFPCLWRDRLTSFGMTLIFMSKWVW